jgi:hypothetical protein
MPIANSHLRLSSQGTIFAVRKAEQASEVRPRPPPAGFANPMRAFPHLTPPSLEVTLSLYFAEAISPLQHSCGIDAYIRITYIKGLLNPGTD